MQVTVSLKNPPSGGTMWFLSLTDWDITVPIHFIGRNGKKRLDIAEAATFEIPTGLNFPLRIVNLTISRWKDGIVGGTIQHLYSIQSWRPYLWDWDLGDYGTDPDPTYREIFIPDYGSYYYNVATERVELIEPPEVVPCEISIDAPDSAEEGETVNVAAIIRNVSAYDYSYKTEIYAEATLLLRTDNIITSGASRGYITSFIMPARDITILVWVERWAVDHWIYDNSASRVVSVEAVPPPLRPPACSISIDAPASAEEGDTVEVIATITNNSEDAQRYKIQMYAGADLIAEWDDTIPGDSANDYAESFTMLARDITILVWVELWWDGKWGYDKAASKVISLVVVPEYRGTIITKELEYDASRGNIPVY